MNVTYLLDRNDISATVRTVLAQADALTARGHRVRIVTSEAPVTWRSSRAEWVLVDDLRTWDRGEDRIVTVDSEVVREHPVVDEELFRTRLPREHQPLRVLLAGASQVESKGLDDGYGAAAHARWFHQTFELVRVAPWTPSREEPLDSVQEFHIALSAAEMTRLVHSCDIAIIPSRREEGLSLVALEAMAAGLACVMSAIPAHRAFGEAALLAPEDNAVELGERLIEVLTDPELRTRVRLAGRDLAAQWRAEAVAPAIETLIQKM